MKRATMTRQETRDFLQGTGAWACKKIRGTHSFTKSVLHWPFCAHCGLCLLKNDATRKAMKSPCVRYE